MLGAVEDGDIEADVVLLGRVVQAKLPVDVALAGRLQFQLVAVVHIVRRDGIVGLVATARGEARRHIGAAVLVEIGRAAEARVAGDIGQLHRVIDCILKAAADRIAVAVQERRRVDQGGPGLLAGALGLQQVHARRSAVGELLVGDVPLHGVRQFP